MQYFIRILEHLRDGIAARWQTAGHYIAIDEVVAEINARIKQIASQPQDTKITPVAYRFEQPHNGEYLYASEPYEVKKPTDLLLWEPLYPVADASREAELQAEIDELRFIGTERLTQVFELQKELEQLRNKLKAISENKEL